MTARQLGPHSQRSHIYSCKRFACPFLRRSPDTANVEDIRRSSTSPRRGRAFCNRNRIMTGLRFCFPRDAATAGRIAAEIYHLPRTAEDSRK